jgi:hypothetical protein
MGIQFARLEQGDPNSFSYSGFVRYHHEQTYCLITVQDEAECTDT